MLADRLYNKEKVLLFGMQPPESFRRHCRRVVIRIVSRQESVLALFHNPNHPEHIALDLHFLAHRIHIHGKDSFSGVVPQNDNLRVMSVVSLVDPPAGRKLKVHHRLLFRCYAFNNRVLCRAVAVSNREGIRVGADRKISKNRRHSFYQRQLLRWPAHLQASDCFLLIISGGSLPFVVGGTVKQR